MHGDVLAFASAPDPVVPSEFLEGRTIVTANAAQLSLEPLGVEAPHITCMRSTMGDGQATSADKLKRLAGRKTGHLVLFPRRADPGCEVQLSLLSEIGYTYDELTILHRLDISTIYNSVLNPGRILLHRTYEPSMGLRAILLALAAGATRVAVAGVSFRSGGASYTSMNYKRIHVDADQEIFARLRKLGAPVFPTDRALSVDTGLPLWPSDQPG
ncbi:hypothetical protein FHY55_17135 [Oceanicola sp. D3]|uniref:hypothetical protein n=1 Tax=Oceanicola sp. D3 TaxID=2587163 RepID=UPI00111DAC48|nr:hypothetical protein [Oceanicola sp. D3]QDC10852.1 hypothetical protein FHY55_17135 [Oceanicola sp. D3]